VLSAPRDGDDGGRFEREAGIGERLRHPGLVRVFAHGRERRLPYLVMELLDGALPLDRYAQAHALSPEARIRLVVEAAEAVHAAHGAGVVHRDLKPDNVLVTGAGAVKVVDFGLARVVDAHRLTQSGAVMGTLHYMAPEQALGQTAHADARTDVYALGALAFALLAQRPPFLGGSAVEVMRAIAEDPPPDVREHAPGAPPAVTEVLRVALAKSPDQRYPSARAFARDLDAAARGSTTWAAGRRATPAARRWLAPLLTLAALTTATAAALFFTRGDAPSPAAVRAGVASLSEDAWSALGRREPFGLLEEEARALGQRLVALEEQAGRLPAPPPRLAEARERVGSFAGLVALARGAPDATDAVARLPEHADSPAALALRGAVAALDSSSDPAAAADALERACRTLPNPELRGWRARARLRAGDRRLGQALADLDALAQARALTRQERILRVRALLGLGRAADARAALAGVEDPPSDLAWTAALEGLAGVLEDDPARALDRIAHLGPPPALTGAQEQALRRLVLRIDRLVRPLLDAARVARDRAPLEAELITLFRLRGRLGSSDTWPPATRAAGLALAELHPDDADVQSAVAGQLQRTQTNEDKLTLVGIAERAIELEEDPDRRRHLELTLCNQLARIVDGPGESYDPARGRRCLELASRLLTRLSDPRDRAVVLASRGRVLRRAGDPEAALADLNDAVDGYPAAEHHLFRAHALLDLGRGEEALADFSAHHVGMVDRSARWADSGVTVWELGYPRGRHATMLRSVDLLLNGYPDWAGWYVRAAWLEAELGNDDRSQTRLSEAVPHWSEQPKLVPLLPRLEAARAASDPEVRRSHLTALVETLEELREGRRP
jgi:tetratricopeptide (TPR) repeat protein